jgi:hypothetical protein
MAHHFVASLFLACTIRATQSAIFRSVHSSLNVDKEFISARGGRGTLVSQKEILASMSVEEAYAVFMRMNHSRSNPELVAFVQQKLGHSKKVDPTRQHILDGVDRARELLNAMVEEAMKLKDDKDQECRSHEITTMATITSVAKEIKYHNKEAAKSRQHVLLSQEKIETAETEKKGVEEQKTNHQTLCKNALNILREQLRVEKADVHVMTRVADTVCAEQVDWTDSKTLVSPAFVQSIVQCDSCKGRKMAWLRNSHIQPMLSSLKSHAVKQSIQRSLMGEFEASAHDRPGHVEGTELLQQEVEGLAKQMKNPDQQGEDLQGEDLMYTEPLPMREKHCDEEMAGPNASKYEGCQDRTVNGHTCQSWADQWPHNHTHLTPELFPGVLGDNNYCRNPNGMKSSIWCYTEDVNIEWEYCEPKFALKAPGVVRDIECEKATSCKMMAAPHCDRLRDRFLVILAGMMDSMTSVSNQLNLKSAECEAIKNDFIWDIESLSTQLMEEDTDLAESTSSMNANQQASEDKHHVWTEEEADYHETQTECCETQNNLVYEVCALLKIRGELYRMENIESAIIDCEVGQWVPADECSVTCAGGDQNWGRGVTRPPTDNGTQCPPLSMELPCNTQACPIDCKLDEWGSWSECTARCGGGVQERGRTRMVEPESGGNPCPSETETRSCNVGACSADCVLKDWSDWTLCSKQCDVGHEQRQRDVTTEPIGYGDCAHVEAPERMEHKECSVMPCSSLMTQGRTFLRCPAEIDLVLVLEGSASLGESGWQEFRSLSSRILGALGGSPSEQNYSKVNVAFMVFNGPTSTADLRECTSHNESVQVNLEDQCGIKWLSHFTSDLGSVQRQVEGLDWPGRTTLTSLAIAEAESELIRGRQGVNSVVVVFTDGKPMSPIRTGEAAESLKSKAKLVWVAVGDGGKDSLEDFKRWGSKPSEDNTLLFGSFADLTLNSTVNEVIRTACPEVA